MLMKLQVKNLADVFGWMNSYARDVAYSFGNRFASYNNICLVMQATGKIKSIMGPFEMAAKAISLTQSSSGTAGRPFKPFHALLFRTPELKPH